MKNFYEMLRLLENEENQDQNPDRQNQVDSEEGLANQDPEVSQDIQNQNQIKDGSDLKNYMFFSNLKLIRKKVDELLSINPQEIDAMLEDGHDWASDHIATSKDDIEEVYSWIMGEQK